MDMDQLQENLEESLEQLDVIKKERDIMKDKYENENYYILHIWEMFSSCILFVLIILNLTRLRLLTRPSPLTRIDTLYRYIRLLTGSISFTRYF